MLKFGENFRLGHDSTLRLLQQCCNNDNNMTLNELFVTVLLNKDEMDLFKSLVFLCMNRGII